MVQICYILCNDYLLSGVGGCKNIRNPRCLCTIHVLVIILDGGMYVTDVSISLCADMQG